MKVNARERRGADAEAFRVVLVRGVIRMAAISLPIDSFSCPCGTALAVVPIRFGCLELLIARLGCE
eukprot:3514225-Prymnesium_polylepis.3